ncbi:MAG: GTP-binding protein, partial [Rhodobacteraceae bacterium]|nr:GTP-binding protein [Paracoccaceae bacterium]
MTSTDSRVPVTLLTGFLGAGKTTLLNHLIRDPEAGRIAVIMNEFGDVGLDHDLIEETTEETVLMQSGCLCCSILGNLAQTLESLRGKRAAGTIDFDRIVIETTGIADPAPIIHTLATDYQIARNFRLDGVVTLADAATGMQTLDRHFEAVRQVAMADVLIVSKRDLVEAFDLSRFEARLEKSNASARRIYANRGRVPLGVLFGLSAMKSDVTYQEVEMWLGMAEQAAKPDPLAGLSGFAKQSPAPLAFNPPAPAPAENDHRVISAFIEVAEPIAADVFDFWL